MRALATGMLVAAAMSAAALTWTRPNSPTAQTIALYHFDEAGGSVASNAAGAARALTLEIPAMRATASNTWWNGGTGFLVLSNGYTATCATFALTRDWALDDLTISFWLRHHAHGASPAGLPPLDATNTMRCGLDWPQAGLDALQLWWRAAPVSVTAFTWNATADGAWHHYAYAYRAADQQLFWYVDNALITSGVWAAGAGTGTLAALTLGAWPAAELWSADDLDELLIEHACLTDFSDGHVPEPVCMPWLVALMLCKAVGLRARTANASIADF